MNDTTPYITPFDGMVPKIDHTVYVDVSARIIGNVTISEGASIWPMAVIRADAAKVVIGRRVAISDFAFIESPEGYPVFIEEEALISHGAVIHGARIDSHSLVGIGAIVLDGAVISSGSIIGAGSFIAAGTHIPPNSLVMGTPGRVIREVKPGEHGNVSQQIRLLYERSRKHMGK
jgi:carbonic anhydrase/acetyltransferase-like protein (isoleucine patch superfamily)